MQRRVKVKVKEVDLYSTFIEVPYTQGAEVTLMPVQRRIIDYALIHVEIA